MARHVVSEIEVEDLRQHPAVIAWAKLRPKRVVPVRIMFLKERRKMSAKSAVYRLEGVGPKGSGIVAKRCRRWSALLERKIYEEILPRLPVQSLGYLGFVEEPDSDYCWLFTEDAGDQWYCPEIEAHRILASQWLSRVHMHATKLDLTGFPDRGLAHYRDQLQFVRANLWRIQHDPSLSEDDRSMLWTLIAYCDALKGHWREIEAICGRLPPTLVHGDLVRKNLRIRNNRGIAEFVAVDWENTGIGSLATDLARSPSVGGLSDFVAAPSITAYWSSVRHHWTGLSSADLREAANVGLVFRCLSAIQWEVERIDANGYMARCMPRLAIFRDGLIEAMTSGGWIG